MLSGATKYQSSTFLTYAVHAPQSCEGSFCHPLDTVLMDPQLNQGGRQVLRDRCQQILGEVEFLHVLQGNKCSGVDFGNTVVPQRQSLKKEKKNNDWKGKIQLLLYLICVKTSLAQRHLIKANITIQNAQELVFESSVSTECENKKKVNCRPSFSRLSIHLCWLTDGE